MKFILSDKFNINIIFLAKCGKFNPSFIIFFNLYLGINFNIFNVGNIFIFPLYSLFKYDNSFLVLLLDISLL